MNIGMVLHHPFPPDIRVEKEAHSLIEAGHEVHLLAYKQEQSSEPLEETCEGVRVRRIPPYWRAMRQPLKSANSLMFHLGFRDPYLYFQIKRYARDFNIEALHVHDLPVAGTTITAGRRLGIPVIVDLHENWPAALQVWGRSPGVLRNWLEKNHRRWVANERWAVRHATHVIVVVDEAKQRLVDRYGIAEQKITVVGNTADTERLDRHRADVSVLDRNRDDFIVSYVGGMGPHRGVDTAILAMKSLGDLQPKATLLLVGAQGEFREQLSRLIHQEGLEDRVEMLGWQPFDKVTSYIAVSSVCLIPHHRNEHTDSTIPHKLFQYMYLGKPVVVSDCPPLKRIVEETQSGLVFHGGDPEDLAQAIRTLHNRRQLCEEAGRLGRQAVIDRYNWKEESKKLFEVYSKLGEIRSTE